MTKNKNVIRIGDQFKHGNDVYKVIDTKPGGRIELFCKERARFLDSWHRIVKSWDRVEQSNN